MEERREKCSGEPERKKRSFPYRPRDAPRPVPLDGVPGPDDPRFATISRFFKQRKDDAALRRQAHLDAHRRRVEAIADTKMRRALEREEAERQRGIDEFWHSLNRRVRPEPRQDQGSPAQTPDTARSPRPSRSPFQLAAYPGPIVDRRGRIGVFLSSTYLAAKTTEYGCLKRLSYYVTKPDHLEAEGSFFSNMGEDRHEIAIGMALVEDANRAARANAKVAVTHIVQLPHDVSPEERVTILKLWCEEHLGVHDLPFVASVHKPSADGDQRNFHGHVVSSFRPAYRTGRYAWRIGRAPRTDLDNPTTFDEYRRDFATLMTAVVQIAGHDRVYTHLSHAGRGLKHKPTEKLGPQKTRQVRDGDYVAANARNAQTIATNEALAAIDRLDERAERNRRRIARLAVLRDMSARVLSPIVQLPTREQREDVRMLKQSLSPALPIMTSELLATAFRIANLGRAHTTDGAGDDVPALIDVPTLQSAAALGDQLYPSTVRTPQIPVGNELRTLSQPLRMPVVKKRSASLPPIIDAAQRGAATTRLPSTFYAPDRRVVTVRPLNPVMQVDTYRAAIRPISSTPRTRPVTVEARQISDRIIVDQTSVRSTLPPRVEAASPPSAALGRLSSKVSAPAREPVDARAVVPMAMPVHLDRAPVQALSAPIRVERSTIRAKHPSDLSRSGIGQRDTGLVRSIGPVRLARLGKRANEIEREAQAGAEAKTAMETADRQQREHRRYLRFVALIALNPDWLTDGAGGIDLAPHAPSEMKVAFTSWSNAHLRLQEIASIRQATLDGMHRLSHDIVRDIGRTIVDVTPRLPPPPPLRDAKGRLSAAGEVILALAVDASSQVPVSGDPTRLPLDAAPALRMLVARHVADPYLPALLVSAGRLGTGVTSAVEIGVARSVDQRRMGFALRRKAGLVPVLTPACDRLSPAMVDHLARARLHPEYLDNTPHLGLGLGEAASRVFHDQWTGWSDPKLARRLLIENAGAPASGMLLTPAMRAQVTARVQTLAGRGGNSGAAGIAPTVDRSR